MMYLIILGFSFFEGEERLIKGHTKITRMYILEDGCVHVFISSNLSDFVMLPFQCWNDFLIWRTCRGGIFNKENIECSLIERPIPKSIKSNTTPEVEASWPLTFRRKAVTAYIFDCSVFPLNKL